jgi:predicted transcriptional regulator
MVAATLHAVVINIKNSANLSPSQLRRCLLLSLDSSLLRVDKRDGWIYRITQKGLQFLDVYEKISGMIRYTEKNINS